MKLCDRCQVPGCCLDYLGVSCARARKKECPDVVPNRAEIMTNMELGQLAELVARVGDVTEQDAKNWLESEDENMTWTSPWHKAVDSDMPPNRTPVLVAWVDIYGNPHAGDTVLVRRFDSWMLWEGSVKDSEEPFECEVTHWRHIPNAPDTYDASDDGSETTTYYLCYTHPERGDVHETVNGQSAVLRRVYELTQALDIEDDDIHVFSADKEV